MFRVRNVTAMSFFDGRLGPFGEALVPSVSEAVRELERQRRVTVVEVPDEPVTATPPSTEDGE